jgi:hypothetical protein
MLSTLLTVLVGLVIFLIVAAVGYFIFIVIYVGRQPDIKKMEAAMNLIHQRTANTIYKHALKMHQNS